MERLVRQGKWIATILALIGIFAITRAELRNAYRMNHQLSPVADAFSESNSVRAAEYFLQFGLVSNLGLPNFTYSSRFADFGTKALDPASTNYIYTHYPPGADWLATFSMMVFGKENVNQMRILPILVSTAGLATLVFTAIWAVSAPFGLLLLWILSAIPATRNMMHGLHYQGYALGLIFMQFAVMIRLFQRGDKPTKKHLAALGGLGFLQGWLSFDYVFVVAFAWLPFVVWAREGFKDWLRQAPVFRGLLLLAPGIGFGLAHVIHFIEVAAFLGGIGPAIQDFRDTAKFRMSDSTPWGEDVTIIKTLVRYYREHNANQIFFARLWKPAVQVFALLGIGWIVEAIFAKGSQAKPAKRAFLAASAAYFVSSMWILAMPQHAYIHITFLPRHYFQFVLWSFAGGFYALTYYARVGLARLKAGNVARGTAKSVMG